MQAQPLHVPDLGPLIGRKEETEALLESLRAGNRLITIAGPSGMGKSRLAAEVIGELQDDPAWASAVRICKLEGYTRPTQLLEVLLDLFDDVGARERDLVRIIGDRPLLLLLDDLEPPLLPIAASLLDKLLDGCPQLQLLLTSLAPLGIEGETQFELGPLSIPAAEALYLERSHRVAAGRLGKQSDGPAIETLMRRLDGIPLAIELAAAKARVLPPRALLSRMEGRFELLQRGGSGRHRSLYRAAERTWDLLSGEEKLFASKASTFQGGFTLEAAEAAIGGEEGACSTLEILAQLRNKGMIRVDESVPPRYLPYETFREFAALRLRQQPHEKETIRRHAAYFLDEGERRLGWLEAPEAPEALEWIAAEQENLLAAHRRCRREFPSSAARLGLIAASVLGIRPIGEPALELADSIVDAARSAGDPRLLIRALLLRIQVLRREGRADEAKLAFDEGLALARRSGELRLEGLLLCELPREGTDRASLEADRLELEEVRRQGAELGAPSLEACALLVLGRREEQCGEPAAALRRLEEGLRLAQLAGDVQLEARILAALGGVYVSLSRFREARATLREASSIFQTLGDRDAHALTVIHLGRVELGLGRLPQGEAYAREALAMTSSRATQAEAEGLLGQIALAKGEPRLAEERLAAAVAGLQGSGLPRLLAEMLAFLAAAASIQGRHLEAQRILHDAKARLEDPEAASTGQWLELLEATLDLHRGRWLLQTNRDDDALALVRRAKAEAAAAQQIPPEEAGSSLFLSIRILERALGELREEEAAKQLTVGPGASWFSYGGLARVGLQRRRALRRLLAGLVEQRLEAPGVGLSSLDLFRLGWVGEDIGVESATARVYTGIWTLRSLGLSEVLVNKGDGYMLDPGVGIEIVD